jgi:hypothetical protein
MALPLLALLVALSPTADTFELVPTDDVWVYPHASEPETDPYLRAWGDGASSVDAPGRTPDIHSYSYLRFDLSQLPTKFKVLEAKLKLVHAPDPAFAEADSKAAPLEARALAGEFNEKTWTFESAAKVSPVGGKEALWGSALVGSAEKGKAIPIELDLLKGESRFAEALVKASAGASRTLGLALTSKITPEEGGGVYKVLSKDGPKESRPVLRLVVERSAPPRPAKQP